MGEENIKSLEYIKATMAYEGLEIPSYMLEILRKIELGEYTSEEASDIILKKHGLKK